MQIVQELTFLSSAKKVINGLLTFVNPWIEIKE